jgi:sugar lactone lactonase YvrE
VADQLNDAVRRIDSYGLVTTVAGHVGMGIAGWVDGSGNAARFYQPHGIAVTPDSTTIYVADTMNNRIRRIQFTGPDATRPQSWMVSTIAGNGLTGGQDGPGDHASFNAPVGITIGPDGALYVTELLGNRIRRISPGTGDLSVAANWTVSSLAGDNTQAAGASGNRDGTGAIARFNGPAQVTAGPGALLYVAYSGNDRIRQVALDGVVSTLAGTTQGIADGPGQIAMFNAPAGIAFSPAGALFTADTGNDRIRSVGLDGIVTTVAGANPPGDVDGPGNVATFYQPEFIAAGTANQLYLTDFAFNNIRVITTPG